MLLTSNNSNDANETGPFYIPVTPLPEDMPLFMQAGSGSDGSGSGDGGSNDDGGDDGGDGNTDECSCMVSGNLLVKDYWYHPTLGKDQPIQWNVSGGIFQTKVQTDFSATPPIPPHPNQAAPLTADRHFYDILTKCSCYGDFHLEVHFRCPDMRDAWNHKPAAQSYEKGPKGPTCGAPLYGTANWGNSGIYLLDSYEIQIHDSYAEDPQWPITTNPRLSNFGCEYNSKQLCGAVYNQKAPYDGISNLQDYKRVFHDKFAESRNKSGTNFAPDGNWNRIDIYFMAPRCVKGDPSKIKKKATVSIVLNKTGTDDSTGDRVIWKYGINGATSGSRKAPFHYGTKADQLYENENYDVMVGPIGIQEHDSKVEFKKFVLNPHWRPNLVGSEVFDSEWQIPDTTN